MVCRRRVENALQSILASYLISESHIDVGWIFAEPE